TENVAYIDFINEDMDNLQRVLLLLNKLLADEEPNEKIYKGLESIVKKGISPESVNKFRALFLNEEGFLATSDECGECGERSELNYINTQTFELICENCYSKKGSNNKSVLPLGDSLYSNPKLTSAFDLYITNLIAQTQLMRK